VVGARTKLLAVIASSDPAFGSGTFGARYFATRPEWSAEMLLSIWSALRRA
jgi:hypothetical protein